MYKKYLITGGAGFIGSHFCEKVISEDNQFICIDNLFRGHLNNINHILNKNSSSFFHLDLVNEKSISKLENIIETKLPDYILHYAAINGTQYFYDIPFKVASVNSVGTYNLLSAIKRVTSKYSDYKPIIVFASSSEVYGNPEVFPIIESHQTYIRVNEVRVSYAAGKLMSEVLIKSFCVEHKIPFYIFRIFNVYGPRMIGSKYGQVIPEFIKRLSEGEYPLKIIGDGEQTRSFCHVNDHVELSWRAMHNADQNEIYNIGNTNEVRIIDLAINIMEKMKLKPSLKFLPGRSGDPMRRVPSISKLIEKIGNYNFIALETGIRDLLESND